MRAWLLSLWHEELFHAINVLGVGPDEAAAMMCANYARMPFEHAAELRDVMHHLIATDTAPRIHSLHQRQGPHRHFDCAGAVGARRARWCWKTILLSNGDWQPVDTFATNARPEPVAAVMAAPAEFLESALDAIEARCGSFAGYMDTWLGFGDRERAALARLMLS